MNRGISSLIYAPISNKLSLANEASGMIYLFWFMMIPGIAKCADYTGSVTAWKMTAHCSSNRDCTIFSMGLLHTAWLLHDQHWHGEDHVCLIRNHGKAKQENLTVGYAILHQRSTSSLLFDCHVPSHYHHWTGSSLSSMSLSPARPK